MSEQYERNYVGEITLKYFPGNLSRVQLVIDEAGSTLLTMDQVDSLAAILRGWVEKYHQAEHAEMNMRQRSR